MIDALRGHRLVLLDSCIWIYHLERNPGYVNLTRKLLRQIVAGDCRGISSELTLLEIQMAPIRQGRDEVAGEYEILLDNFPNLTLQPVDRFSSSTLSHCPLAQKADQQRQERRLSR